MRRQVLLDTGPLVAFLKTQDHSHNRVTAELASVQPPLLTCEAVIVEARFLLRKTDSGEAAVLSLISDGFIQIPLLLEAASIAVRQLLDRYRSVPMSLADACLVRMAEQYERSFVLTLDKDFQIYRKSKNQLIPLMIPSR